MCEQDCVQGTCVAPNQCRCDFSYVGASCSRRCLCNGHSDCAGPDQLDVCLRCHNNTMVSGADWTPPLTGTAVFSTALPGLREQWWDWMAFPRTRR